MTDASSVLTGGNFEIVRDFPARDTQRLRIYRLETEHDPNTRQITWAQAIALWQQNVGFRSALSQALAESSFTAFFWETPAITPASLHQPWECVVVSAPELSNTTSDPIPFNRYLTGARQDTITTFPNLGRDALLVVPYPLGDLQVYAHMATFVRTAPATQVHRLWQVLGQTLQSRLTAHPDNPLWVSTSGLGVAWLHVRLDNIPKYYTYSPYCRVI